MKVQITGLRDYLWSIAPDGATNSEFARQLGIRVYYGENERLFRLMPNALFG